MHTEIATEIAYKTTGDKNQREINNKIKCNKIKKRKEKEKDINYSKSHIINSLEYDHCECNSYHWHHNINHHKNYKVSASQR